MRARASLAGRAIGVRIHQWLLRSLLIRRTRLCPHRLGSQDSPRDSPRKPSNGFSYLTCPGEFENHEPLLLRSDYDEFTA
jgi:hypothetical protein